MNAGRCLSCSGPLIPPEIGVCEACANTTGDVLPLMVFAFALIGGAILVLLLSGGCASRPPRVVKPLDFVVDPFDNKPLKPCNEVTPAPGAQCFECVRKDELPPGDPLAMGRGSMECIQLFRRYWPTQGSQ